MSRKRAEAKEASGPPPVVPVGTMRLSGLVRTTKGYAVASVEMSPTGDVVAFRLGHSQSHPEFVAIEHKREAARLSGLTIAR